MRTFPIALGAVVLVSLGGALARADDWKVPPEAREQKNPLAASADNVAAGKAVYEERCQMCHGGGGKGDGKASAYLQVKPKDLTSAEVAAEPDGVLFAKVTNGRLPMPGFGSKITEEARWQSILWVRELQKATAPKKDDKK